MATKRQLQAQATKQKIVKVASKLFAERGFDNVTIRDIASECGIGLGTMYHYYSKKEDLLQYNDWERFEDIRKLVDTSKGLNGLEKMYLYLSTIFQSVDDLNINYSRQWHKMAMDQEASLGPDGTNRLEEEMGVILSFLRDAVDEGLLLEDTPVESIAMDIAFTVYGAGLERCMYTKDFAYLEWSDRYVNKQLPLYMQPFLA